MASPLVNLVVPGGGSVADVLAETLSLCGDMGDGQRACERVHKRLSDFYTELQDREREKRRLPSEDLDGFTRLLSKYRKCLAKYQAISRTFFSEMMPDLYALHKGIDSAMKLLLKSTPHQMMEWQKEFADDAARTISTMSDISNRPDMAEAGGIAKLVSFVQSGNAIQKAEAAEVLALVAENEHSRVAIAAAGGVEALVALMRDGNDFHATDALRTLAFKDGNHVAIGAAGSVEALVALARDGNDIKEDNDAHALGTLAFNDGNHGAIAAAGSIEALVALMRYGNYTQKENAADALGSLAFNKANHVAIAEAGGIEALLALVQDGDDIEKHYAARALGILAFNEASHVAIAEAGSIEAPMALARDSNEVHKTKAADALRSLADDDLEKSVAVAQGEGKYPDLSRPQPSRFPHRPRTTFSGDVDAVSSTGEHGFLYELKSSNQPNSKQASAIAGPSPPRRIDLSQNSATSSQASANAATEVERYEMAGVQAMVFPSDHVGKSVGEWLHERAAELDVTSKDMTYGATALHWAAEEGHTEIAKMLINAGADANSTMTNGQTALHRAAAWGHVDVIALLLTNGAVVHTLDKVGRSALFHAAFKGHTAAVKTLVEAGADTDVKTLKFGDTALHVAAGNGYCDAVRVLLEASRYEDVLSSNKDGSTALHKAAANGHNTIVRMLLDWGADVRAKNRVGDTALHAAAERGHLAVVNALLAAAAHVHAVNKRGETPLHRACLLSQEDVVQALMQQGARMTSTAQDGHTPFHFAVFAALHESCSDKTLRVLQLCVEAGATWDEMCDSAGGDGGLRGKSFGTLRSIVISWASHFSSGRPLPQLAIEVFQNGIEAAEAFDNDVQISESTRHRRRLCVLGPNQCGKTSFIKSVLLSDDPPATRMIDSVVGIEQSMTSFRDSASSSIRHDITIWDFYGHDAFQVALAMFFTPRTLFLICVDLQAYAIALMQADLMTESEKQYADWMGDFVETRILRWIRLVQDHHPHAEIVLVGTKADRLYVDPETTLKEIQADLRTRLTAYANEVVRRLDHEHSLTQRQQGQNSQRIETTLHLVGPQVTIQKCTYFDWLLPNLKGKPSARSQLETALRLSGRSFPMPELHTQVLECVTAIAEHARNVRFSDNRTQKTFIPVGQLVGAIQEEARKRVARGEPLSRVMGLPREKCKSILRVLRDLGDVVWYHDLYPVIRPLDSTVIINPLLLIRFVVELLAHEPTDLLQRSQEIMPHGTLQRLPLWREVVYNEVDDDDSTSLMLPLKLLLAHFHIVSSATDRVMRKDSDLFVPAYWRKKTSAPWMFGGDDLRINPRAISSNEPVRIKWEYVFYKHLPDTFFDRFIMASHYFPYDREVGPDWTLFRHTSEFACRVMMGRDCITHRHIIRFEAVTATFEGSKQREKYDRLWDIFRRWGEALERVVREYRGMAVDRFALNLANYPSNLVGAIRGFFDKPSDYARWLPADLAWYREFIPKDLSIEHAHQPSRKRGHDQQDSPERKRRFIPPNEGLQ